jgi:hypothetical protein
MSETIKEISKDVIEITETRTIDLKPIKEEIIQINSMLNEFPIKKIKPDKETLDYWNQKMVDDNLEKADLLERKRFLEDYLKKYDLKK